MSYELSAPIDCDGFVDSSLTISETGLITTKANLEFSKTVDLVFSVDPNINIDYEIIWPNEVPKINQSLILNGTSQQNWYDLESTKTLLVRSNPAPGQFNSITSAINYLNNNIIPGPENMFTVVVAPGFYDESAITSNTNVSFELYGAGMDQTIIKDFKLVTSAERVSLQDLTLNSDNFNTWINVVPSVNNTIVIIKNIGLVGNLNPFVVEGETGTSLVYCDRIWKYATSTETNHGGLLKVSSNSSTKLSISDINLSSPQSIIIDNDGGSNLNLTLKDSLFFGSNSVIYNFNDGFDQITLKNCATVDGSFNVLQQSNNKSLMFYNDSSKLNVNQIDNVNPSNNFPILIQGNIQNSPSVPIVNDTFNYINNYLPFTQGSKTDFGYVDNSLFDMSKQIFLSDDFASNRVGTAFGETPWLLANTNGGFINQFSSSIFSTEFTNGLLTVNAVSNNATVVVSKPSVGTFLTNSQYLRFQVGLQRIDTPSIANNSIYAVGFTDLSTPISSGSLGSFGTRGIWIGAQIAFSNNYIVVLQSDLALQTLYDTGISISSGFFRNFQVEVIRTGTRTGFINVYFNNLKIISSFSPFLWNSSLSLFPAIKSTRSAGIGNNWSIDYFNWYSRSNSLRTK